MEVLLQLQPIKVLLLCLLLRCRVAIRPLQKSWRSDRYLFFLLFDQVVDLGFLFEIFQVLCEYLRCWHNGRLLYLTSYGLGNLRLFRSQAFSPLPAADFFWLRQALTTFKLALFYFDLRSGFIGHSELLRRWT